MSDEDEYQEIESALRTVAETTRLFHISPARVDPDQAGRQIAIVAAETAEEARSFTCKADPMGRDWNDRSLFDVYYQDTNERHVVGDIVFRSIPSPSAPNKS